MEVRKLVKSGLSSYTIALPKEWVERNKLTKGELIYLEEMENKLVISSKQTKTKEVGEDIVISTEDKDIRQLKREIKSAYLNNYNRIIIKGSNLKPIAKEIKSDIHSLASLEVIEESSDKITARSFLDFTDVSVADILRRIDNITRSMFADNMVLISESSKDYDLANVIIDRDLDVNRLTFMIFKVLKMCSLDAYKAKKIGINNVELLKYWNITFIIEKIADSLKRTARIISDMQEKKVKMGKSDMSKLLSEIKKSYEDIMTAYYKKDMALCNKVYLERTELIKKCDEYVDKNKTLEGAEFVGKMKSIISGIDDINKIIRF